MPCEELFRGRSTPFTGTGQVPDFSPSLFIPAPIIMLFSVLPLSLMIIMPPMIPMTKNR